MPLRDGGAEDSTDDLLNRVMYDRRPETYDTYPGLSRVLRESREMALLLEFWPHALRGASPEELLRFLAPLEFQPEDAKAG